MPNKYTMPTLITDRTAADVAEVKRLMEKLRKGETLTDEERAKYLAGMRGAYNAADMNRIGEAIRVIVEKINAERYTVSANPKTSWAMADIVRRSDWKAYLDEVKRVREMLTLSEATPRITDDMYDGIDYNGANAIEQILADTYAMIENIIANYIYSGEIYAGEGQ